MKTFSGFRSTRHAQFKVALLFDRITAYNRPALFLALSWVTCKDVLRNPLAPLSEQIRK